MVFIKVDLGLLKVEFWWTDGKCLPLIGRKIHEPPSNVNILCSDF